MSGVAYLELFRLAVPETILVVTVLAVLGADLVALRGLELSFRRTIAALISCAGCAGAIAWLLLAQPQGSFAEGMLVADSLTRVVKLALLALTILTALISVNTDFTPHAGEYFALLLLATLGMMFLVSTEDILMIFISLELTSLSL